MPRCVSCLPLALDQGIQLADCSQLQAASILEMRAWHELGVLPLQEVKTDPLDQYCEDTPEADECRVYED